jgi:hypothetical protein
LAVHLYWRLAQGSWELSDFFSWFNRPTEVVPHAP